MPRLLPPLFWMNSKYRKWEREESEYIHFFRYLEAPLPSQDSNFQGGHFWALQTSFDHGEGQSGTLSCFWNESLTSQHGKFMGPRFKKHSVLYFPEGREHPHLLATYVKLEPVCNVSSFPPYFKYSLYSYSALGWYALRLQYGSDALKKFMKKGTLYVHACYRWCPSSP